MFRGVCSHAPTRLQQRNASANNHFCTVGMPKRGRTESNAWFKFRSCFDPEAGKDIQCLMVLYLLFFAPPTALVGNLLKRQQKSISAYLLLISHHCKQVTWAEGAQVKAALSISVTAFVNKQRPAYRCVLPSVRLHAHKKKHARALTQPRADSTGIIRNIWDHLQREQRLWWDPDALLGFTENTGTLIYEGPLLAPHPGRFVCVCVCARRDRPHTKWMFGSRSSIFRSGSV